MDTTGYLPTVLSFCSGYAGIERGLDLAGVEHRVLAYVEIEAFAIANLVAKMEAGELDPAPVYTDLKTFPAGLFRGTVDLITGGYPCQPFSAAGQRKGADDPRHLWPYISEAIGIIRPGRVFFENVEGHISLGLNEVISDLEARSYDTTWGIFSAAEVGAPHQRKRVYIMADAASDGYWKGREQRYVHQEDGRQIGQSSPESTGSSEQPENTPTNVGDTVSPRLQGHARNGADSNQQGRQPSQPDRPTGAGSVCNAPQPGAWPTEPDVGRVVDGCADRVDRIRILGNGVVPQTACRAWQVLSNELESNNGIF